MKTDLEANQITVAVPKSVADPRGQWKATLATGLFDPAGGGWLATEGEAPVSIPFAGTPATPTGGLKIINLGFRFNEMEVAPPYAKQTAALEAGAPTQFANLLDFDLLRNRG